MDKWTYACIMLARQHSLPGVPGAQLSWRDRSVPRARADRPIADACEVSRPGCMPLHQTVRVVLGISRLPSSSDATIIAIPGRRSRDMISGQHPPARAGEGAARRSAGGPGNPTDAGAASASG